MGGDILMGENILMGGDILMGRDKLMGGCVYCKGEEGWRKQEDLNNPKQLQFNPLENR